MTDNEIIKALECCSKDDIDCEQCPANGLCDNDDYCFTGAILDLINRQKAEIAKKDTEIDILIRKKEALRDEIAEKQAEIERLHKSQKPTGAAGYKIENGKVIMYADVLNGYRHEYKDLEEIVKELNLYMHVDYKNVELISHYKHKAQTAKSEAYREFALDLKCGVPQETGVIRCANVDDTLKKLLSNDMGRYDHYTDSFVKETAESNE